eukprot:TRINITY_DN455_c1_g1_i1.p1 TRINITY_DN455_c1_g1~~TRINITY_DN455_c1_g1_i1.p1  ORF type:complete len:305 (-),score=66.29 TRINITY_DN455_c1_g1_i1:262-1176(-)
MPIDYSKFDSIDDSDEEKPKTAPVFAPPARQPDNAKTRSSNGKSKTTQVERPSTGPSGAPLLDGLGLEQKLTLFQPGPSPNQDRSSGPPGAGGDPNDMAALAAELERLAGGGGPGAEEQKPGEPKRSCIRSDGRKKIHTTFPDGAEMIEEFDERTDVLLIRRTRKPSKLGKEGEWTYEVGQAPEAAFDPHADLMRASTSNPIFLRKDTPEHFQWRIRNLSYPADVYSVSVDHEKQEIVVRTSNKKYFKRIQVADLARLDLKLNDEKLSWKHQHNTLIISYVRPQEVIQQELKALKEAEKSAMKF